jgi:hypothetical protein
MDRWHYHIGTITIEDMRHPDRLNELGDSGWELIEVERLQDKPRKWLVVFKKPVPTSSKI